MKKNFTSIAVFVLILFVFQSCFSPQNIVRLQPEKNDVKWRYGQQFVSDSLYGVIYEVGFDQLKDNKYWFDFNITNYSNLPVLIDPADFYIQAFNGNNEPLTESRLRAADPENEILEIEKELSKNEARELNQIGFTVLAATADIATGIAVTTDGNPHNNHLRTHLYHHALATDAHHSFQSQNLNEVMDSWKSSTIRKTTLESNYSMQGKVFFPALREADFIKLYLPVDSQHIEMNYKQVQFPVN
ncbi:hypothetical protein [Mariniphaga sp.]|uniref:hypothetical protein n=1 Tax=Mariniphaga sp. TaxID=1954475 RepID=UPI0035625A9A